MKLLKRKNFQALIYAIFISLPMLSILPLTIYFAFNHEAANYTHDEVIETYEYETNEVNSVDDLVVGNIYKFEINASELTDFTGTIRTNFARLFIDEEIIFEVKILENTFDFYIGGSNVNIIFYNPSHAPSIYPKSAIDDNLKTYFIYKEALNNNFLQYISASDYLGEKNVEVIESEMNPMSAFDNAIGKFVSDNDFGRLDFFTFFSSLFLTNSSMNNLYIHFINWYMNYALYVSLAYLLFGVLLYFVNFFRKLVENSEDTHIGGF